MKSVKEKQNTAFKELKDTFGYRNSMEVPHITKVVISSGTGLKSKRDKNYNDFVSLKLSKITGQKASQRGARLSIASFKLREGDIIGNKTTLRGDRMYDFLDRFFNIAVPRIRDFRGFDTKSIDDVGNITLGIKEHNIFPETADEDLKDVFGLSVTIVTTAKNKEEAEAFLRVIGVPLKKKEEVQK